MFTVRCKKVSALHNFTLPFLRLLTNSTSLNFCEAILIYAIFKQTCRSPYANFSYTLFHCGELSRDYVGSS